MALSRETDRWHFSSDTDCCLKDPDQIKSKLQKIVDVYGSLHNSQYDCLKSYPIWFRKRRNSIKQLELLKDEVETRKKNCDAVKFVGEAVSLIGDAVSVFGAILNEMEQSNTSRTMMKKGRAGGLLGGAISCGASAYGSYIDNEDSKKLKRILQIDEEESATLLEFRNTTEEFKALVEEIMEFDVFSNIMKGFETLKQEVRSFHNSKSKKFQSALPADVLEMIRYLPLPGAAKPNVVEFMKVLYSSIECWNLFKVLIKMRKKDPFVFQAACLIGRISLHGLQILQDPISSLSLNFLSNAILPSEGNDHAIAQGVISTVSLATDLMNIMDTSKEIMEETPSEFLKYLQECIKMMRDELDVWEEIYRNYMEHQNMS